MSEHQIENEQASTPVINVGGSIEKALRGEYKLNVSAILQEAYQTTLKTRASINLGLIFSFIIALFVTLVFSEHLGGIEAALQDQQASFLLNLVVTIVVYPFLVGVEMMGIYHSVGLKTKPNLVFAFLKRGSWVAICALLTSSLISLGLTIIVPAIYLAVALSLVLPLVVEKRLSPVKAIVLSLKATRFQWFAMFKVYLATLMALFVCLLPAVFINANVPDMNILGMGIFIVMLSYLAPFFYNIKGILYREIFGLTIQTSLKNSSASDDVFTA